MLGILRYALLLEQGDGGAPEELVLADRVLLVMGAVWALFFAIAVHGRLTARRRPRAAHRAGAAPRRRSPTVHEPATSNDIVAPGRRAPRTHAA